APRAQQASDALFKCLGHGPDGHGCHERSSRAMSGSIIPDGSQRETGHTMDCGVVRSVPAGYIVTRRIIIIAGPNGAGKTTFARQFLPNEAGCPNFVNADLIAAGLSPFDPDAAAVQAGRLMLAEIRRYLQAGESFAFETTLSGKSYARQIPQWREAGY